MTCFVRIFLSTDSKTITTKVKIFTYGTLHSKLIAYHTLTIVTSVYMLLPPTMQERILGTCINAHQFVGRVKLAQIDALAII